MLRSMMFATLLVLLAHATSKREIKRHHPGKLCAGKYTVMNDLVVTSAKTGKVLRRYQRGTVFPVIRFRVKRGPKERRKKNLEITYPVCGIADAHFTKALVIEDYRIPGEDLELKKGKRVEVVKKISGGGAKVMIYRSLKVGCHAKVLNEFDNLKMNASVTVIKVDGDFVDVRDSDGWVHNYVEKSNLTLLHEKRDISETDWKKHFKMIKMPYRTLVLTRNVRSNLHVSQLTKVDPAKETSTISEDNCEHEKQQHEASKCSGERTPAIKHVTRKEQDHSQSADQKPKERTVADCKSQVQRGSEDGKAQLNGAPGPKEFLRTRSRHRSNQKHRNRSRDNAQRSGRERSSAGKHANPTLQKSVDLVDKAKRELYRPSKKNRNKPWARSASLSRSTFSPFGTRGWMYQLTNPSYSKFGKL